MLTKQSKIAASDLRIGNYQQTPDFNTALVFQNKIEGKCYNKLNAYALLLISAGLFKFRPILITEEWLLALGFTYNSNGVLSVIIFKQDRFVGVDGLLVLPSFILLEAQRVKIPLYGSFRFKMCYYDYDLKPLHTFPIGLPGLTYVHELQNRYWIETGKELFVK